MPGHVVAAAVGVLSNECSTVVTIGAAELLSLAELERYDAIVFSQTLALTLPQRTAVLLYTARGAGAVGVSGLLRWAPGTMDTYGYRPFLSTTAPPGHFLWP